MVKLSSSTGTAKILSAALATVLAINIFLANPKENFLIPLAKPTDYTIRITWSDKTIIRANPTWISRNSGWLK